MTIFRAQTPLRLQVIKSAPKNHSAAYIYSYDYVVPRTLGKWKEQTPGLDCTDSASMDVIWHSQLLITVY